MSNKSSEYGVRKYRILFWMQQSQEKIFTNKMIRAQFRIGKSSAHYCLYSLRDDGFIRPAERPGEWELVAEKSLSSQSKARWNSVSLYMANEYYQEQIGQYKKIIRIAQQQIKQLQATQAQNLKLIPVIASLKT